MRLLGVDTGRLKYKLTCHFKLVADTVRKFLNDTDGPAFLEKELIGTALAESSILYIISTGMSQVGVALLPFF